MDTVPIELLEAQAHEHRLELAKRDMQLARYRLCLEQHGIEPPDADGEELLAMLRDCRTVITTASQFMMRLGSGRELLMDWGTGAPV